jgi:magnesium-protoporphyrin O-methyltransferase
MTYEATRTRVETYFDRTATRTWERLTSDAPVSRIRETVRLGRDQMRELLLSSLPEDLSGARVLDAGCGTGQATQELVKRGARVVAVDISPSLISIARKRLPEHMHTQVQFEAGDMLSEDLGYFDHVVAMDSLIYYRTDDIRTALTGLSTRTDGSILFSVAPRTPLLMTMWRIGKLFPRTDRSPVMVPHSAAQLAHSIAPHGRLRVLGRVTSGFYISEALEFRT